MEGAVGPLVESRLDPDGKVFWIDYRPLPPSWDDPRSNPSNTLPDGIIQHLTPDGREFFLDTRPRLTWTKPTDVAEGGSSGIRTTSSSKAPTGSNATTLYDTPQGTPRSSAEGKSDPSSSSSPHMEVKLLMNLTRWRMAHILSGYPDSRTDDVDLMINILQTRLDAFSSVDTAEDLKPLEAWFIEGANTLISSHPTINFLQPMKRSDMNMEEDPFDVRTTIWVSFVRPLLYTVLLSVPIAYKQRLGRAEWTQWVSSKRWVEQQQAMDGFLKALIAEWNLMILLSTLILSASVGFLSVPDVSRVAETGILISLVFSLASITIDVAFVWRYQRQLTNNFDMQRVMDEFIYKAEEDVLAIFLSLPVSFLLWSVLTFALSVVAYAWNRLPWLESPIAVTATIGLVFTLTIVTWTMHQLNLHSKKKGQSQQRSERSSWKGGARGSPTIHLNRPRDLSDPAQQKLGVKGGNGGVGRGGEDGSAIHLELKPLDEAGTA